MPARLVEVADGEGGAPGGGRRALEERDAGEGEESAAAADAEETGVECGHDEERKGVQ